LQARALLYFLLTLLYFLLTLLYFLLTQRLEQRKTCSCKGGAAQAICLQALALLFLLLPLQLASLLLQLASLSPDAPKGMVCTQFTCFTSTFSTRTDAEGAGRVRHECGTDESPEELRDVTDVSAVLSVTVSSPSVCDVGGAQMPALQFRVRDDSLGPQIHDDSLLADISASSILASARSAAGSKGVSSAHSPADAVDAVADADANTRVSSTNTRVSSFVASSGTQPLTC
jgi:hypothetical protein